MASVLISGAQSVARSRRLQERTQPSPSATIWRDFSNQIVKAQENERRFIARELHDEIGQSLTELNLLLARSLSMPEAESAAAIRQSLTVVNRLMARVRALSLDLRPAMLDDLGLLAALEWQCDRFTERTRIAVDLKHSGLRRKFPPDIANTAYRIVQECLTNAARYARVDRVRVSVVAGGVTLSICVADWGVGFDQSKLIPGLTGGLSGMRERALLVGGQLRIESRRGYGTTVTAILPLSDDCEARL